MYHSDVLCVLLGDINTAPSLFSYRKRRIQFLERFRNNAFKFEICTDIASEILSVVSSFWSVKNANCTLHTLYSIDHYFPRLTAFRQTLVTHKLKYKSSFGISSLQDCTKCFHTFKICSHLYVNSTSICRFLSA